MQCPLCTHPSSAHLKPHMSTMMQDGVRVYKCGGCGYVQPVDEAPTPDLGEQAAAKLDEPSVESIETNRLLYHSERAMKEALYKRVEQLEKDNAAMSNIIAGMDKPASPPPAEEPPAPEQPPTSAPQT